MMRISPRAPAWLVLIATVSALATEAGPVDVVKQATAEILTALKESTLEREARWMRIAPVIERSFDFQSMSQSVLATQWRIATEAEKQQFVEFFSQYIENTYRNKIEAYTNQRIEYTGEKIRGERAVVDTEIITDSTRIPVSYRMRRDDSGRWRAYDVIIEHVSLVSNYRSTYAAISKTGGMDGILSDLQLRLGRHDAGATTQ